MASSAAHSKASGIQRQEIQSAIAKAVELRAIHAALVQGSGSSPAATRLPAGASPSVSRFSNHFPSAAAADYPIFTPSYEEDPLPGYRFIHPDRRYSENWSEFGVEGEARGNEQILSDTNSVNKFASHNNEQLVWSANEHLSNKSLCLNQKLIMQTAPEAEVLKSSSRRSATGELKNLSTYSAGNSETISREVDADLKKYKCGNSIVPSVDTHAATLPPQSKNKGAIFSRLFHRTKKKAKPGMSPTAVESEDMSQILNDWGIFSLETLKRELLEANQNRDAALAEVAEMRSSLGELQEKLASLESYCEELRSVLKQAVQSKEKLVPNASKRSKPISGSQSSSDSSLPVSHDVMVEGFLQMVSEARLSVKHFCKNLINQINKTDACLLEKLSTLLHPYIVTLENKYTKGVLYNLEALINQSLYENFENCVFRKNGSRKVLDPQQDCCENFSAFVALRNLGWNEVLKKGTKYHSEDFSYFCDEKMSCIVSILNWSRPWPELLLQSFFVATKCIWLLHLLAFSFNPPLVILRVDPNRSFDPMYMEDVLRDKQQHAQAPTKVKIMVMPGFYVQDKVLRCRVLCR